MTVAKDIGRPALYETPEDMQVKIDEYFLHCEKGREVTRPNKRGEIITYTERIPPTVIGLALYLGFADHRGLYEVQNRKPKFLDIITHAKARCAEDKLTNGMLGHYESRITQLDLAANHGMSMKQEIQITDDADGLTQEERDILKVIASKVAKEHKIQE